MKHRHPNRLRRAHRAAIYALTGLLLATGAAWLVVAYALAPPGEPLPAPHPWAGPLLATHGIAAYAALVAYALVGHVHIATGWRLPGQRGAGAALLVVAVALALTGLGFYYVADEAAVPVIRWLHVGVGLLLPPALAFHIVRGRRNAARR
jgi:hypothetical protein